METKDKTILARKIAALKRMAATSKDAATRASSRTRLMNLQHEMRKSA
jgi:hypothetical protein